MYISAGLTVVSSVGPADGGRVDAGLTGGHKAVRAESNTCGRGVYCVPGEGLEIQPEPRDRNKS